MARGINLNQSGNEWNGATLHPQGGRNSRVHHQQTKLWLVFRGERGVIFVIIWPLNWCSKKSDCSPLLSYPQEKCQNYCYSIKTPSHRSIRTVEAVRKFGWTVLLHPPCSYNLALRFSLFIHFKDSLWGHHYPNEEALQNNILKWLQREENNFYWAWMHTLVERWKKKGY